MINYALEIKDAVTMQNVCDAYGISVDRQHNAICPFHKDSHASMHVYDGRRGWHCFVCDTGGDVIDFVQKYFGLSFTKACAKMNDDFHLGLPIGRELTLQEMREAENSVRERKARAAARDAEHQKLINEYHTWYDLYAYYDKLKRNNDPSVVGEINHLYADAVKHIDEVAQWLDEAEARLNEYEHNGYGNS